MPRLDVIAALQRRIIEAASDAERARLQADLDRALAKEEQ